MQVRAMSWTKLGNSAALAGGVALVVAVGLLGVADAGEQIRQFTTRLVTEEGTKRQAAIAWSQEQFEAGAQAREVILSRDDVFADALSSGGVQCAVDGPLLLSERETLSSDARTELERLGPTRITLMGGEAAISEVVARDLGENHDVRRLLGETRIETAINAASTVHPDAQAAILARAHGGDEATQSFADAMAAGAAACVQEIPVLLSETDQLSATLRDYLDSSDIKTVYVAGGTGAVSDEVVAQMQSLGVSVQRFGGANRAETAVAITQGLLEGGKLGATGATLSGAGDVPCVVMVEGYEADSWASGFASARYVAENGCGFVLSNGSELPPETLRYLQDGDGGTTGLVCGPLTELPVCEQAAEALGHDFAGITLQAANVKAGESFEGTVTGDFSRVTAAGCGIPAGTAITVDPETGDFSLAVPDDAEPGDDILTFTVTYADGFTSTQQVQCTVAAPTPTPTPSPTGGGGGGGGGGGPSPTPTPSPSPTPTTSPSPTPSPTSPPETLTITGESAPTAGDNFDLIATLLAGSDPVPGEQVRFEVYTDAFEGSPDHVATDETDANGEALLAYGTDPGDVDSTVARTDTVIACVLEDGDAPEEFGQFCATVTGDSGFEPRADRTSDSFELTIEPGPPASLGLEPFTPAHPQPVRSAHRVVASAFDQFSNPTPLPDGQEVRFEVYRAGDDTANYSFLDATEVSASDGTATYTYANGDPDNPGNPDAPGEHAEDIILACYPETGDPTGAVCDGAPVEADPQPRDDRPSGSAEIEWWERLFLDVQVTVNGQTQYDATAAVEDHLFEPLPGAVIRFELYEGTTQSDMTTYELVDVAQDVTAESGQGSATATATFQSNSGDVVILACGVVDDEPIDDDPDLTPYCATTSDSGLGEPLRERDDRVVARFPDNRQT